MNMIFIMVPRETTAVNCCHETEYFFNCRYDRDPVLHRLGLSSRCLMLLISQSCNRVNSVNLSMLFSNPSSVDCSLLKKFFTKKVKIPMNITKIPVKTSVDKYQTSAGATPDSFICSSVSIDL